MPQYLKQIHRTWYAVLEIPKDLRRQIGKVRFKQSLKTDSFAEAKLRVLPWIVRWKRTIEAARNGETLKGPNPAELREWALEYREASPEKRRELDDILEDMSGRQGDGPEASWEKIVKGTSAAIADHVEEWVSTLRDTPKTVDMKRATILEFGERFEFSHQVTKQSARQWVHNLQHPMGEEAKGLALNTVQRKLSALRGYWRFLQDRGYLQGEDEPFSGILKSSKGAGTKAASEDERIPLTNQEVVDCLDRAIEKGDDSLAALIWVAAWTGCRINEICSLRVEDVFEDRILIRAAKTKAGNREVPLHSKLKEAMHQLRDTSYDGYVLSGLSANMYSKKADTMSKRFGRMKRAMKLDKEKVFHSIRKTVVTQMEQAMVPEPTTQSVLGHKRGSITYGLYSGGPSFENKQEAIEHLSYPLEEVYHFRNAKD